MSARKTLPPFLLFSVLLISGCLYTSHNYNTGRVLKGGQSAVTVSYGRRTLAELECREKSDSEFGRGDLVKRKGKVTCRYTKREDQSVDSIFYKPTVDKDNIPSLSFGYALGIRNNWGPFPGLDMGFQIETPTQPISAEFYFRLGLPHPLGWKISHSVSLGYIIGAWADNSHYLGYAMSRQLGKHLAYANFRSTLMATQMLDIWTEEMEDSFKFPHKRRLVNQVSAGFMMVIPDMKIIPDFIMPQVNCLYPNIPLAFDSESFGYDYGGLAINWNIGLGWQF